MTTTTTPQARRWRPPSYAAGAPAGWCGDPRRGAALGRPTVDPGPTFAGTVTLRAVRLTDGYDRTGCYFGCRGPWSFLLWVGTPRINGRAPLDAVLGIDFGPLAGPWSAAVAEVRRRWPLVTIRLPPDLPPHVLEPLAPLLTPTTCTPTP